MKACYFGQEDLLNDFIFKYNCDLTLKNKVIKFPLDPILTNFTQQEPGRNVLDLVRAYFGVVKYEQLKERIMNELENRPPSLEKGLGENNEAIEEETREDDSINPAGLHSYSFLN